MQKSRQGKTKETVIIAIQGGKSKAAHFSRRGRSRPDTLKENVGFVSAPARGLSRRQVSPACLLTTKISKPRHQTIQCCSVHCPSSADS